MPRLLLAPFLGWYLITSNLLGGGLANSTSEFGSCVGSVAGIPLHAPTDAAAARGALLPALLQATAVAAFPGSFFLALSDRVLLVDVSGTMSLLVGGGGGQLPGLGERVTGTLASVSSPLLEAGGPGGELLVSDGRGAITAFDLLGDGTVRLIVGNLSAGQGWSPDGTPAEGALISPPACLAVAPNGDFFFCDVPGPFGGALLLRTARQVAGTTGGAQLATVAGNGSATYAVDGAPDARGTGFAGIVDAFFDPASGDLLVAERGPWVLPGFISNSQISRVTPSGSVRVIAGNVSARWVDWFASGTLASAASLNFVTTVCASPLNDGAVYFAEFPRVVRLAGGVLTVLSGQTPSPIVSNTWAAFVDGSPAASASLGTVFRVRPDTALGALLVTDVSADVVYRLYPATGAMDIVAGRTLALAVSPAVLYSARVLATQAGFPAPNDVAVNPTSGDVFSALTPSNVVVRLSAQDGSLLVVAGTGTWGCGAAVVADATTASLATPTCSVLDGRGGLVICDYSNCLLRRVDVATGAMRVIAGDIVGRCAAATHSSARELYASVNSGTTEQASSIVGSASHAAVDPGTGDVYWTEYYPARVMVLRAVSGQVFRVAGNGATAEAPLSPIALNAPLQGPSTIKCVEVWLRVDARSARVYPATLSFRIGIDGSAVFIDGFYSVLRLRQNGSLDLVARFTAPTDAVAGSVDGPLSSATAYALTALAILPDGDFLVADSAVGSASWSVIREIDPVDGTITRIAGTFTHGGGGTPLTTSLGYISAIDVHPGGNLLLADAGWDLLWAVLFSQDNAAYW